MSQGESMGSTRGFDYYKSLSDFLQQKIDELEKKREEALQMREPIRPLILLQEVRVSLDKVIIELRALKKKVDDYISKRDARSTILPDSNPHQIFHILSKKNSRN